MSESGVRRGARCGGLVKPEGFGTVGKAHVRLRGFKLIHTLPPGRRAHPLLKEMPHILLLGLLVCAFTHLLENGLWY